MDQPNINPENRLLHTTPAEAPKDPNVVDVLDDAELLYWAHALKVSPEQVIQAAKDVGNSAVKVESRLLQVG